MGSQEGPAGRQTGSPTTARSVRSVAEPLVFVGLALAFLWVIRPTDNDWLKIPFLVIVVAIPFLSNYLHRDTLRELGLRFDNFWPSAREVGLFSLVAAAAVIAIGVLSGAGPSTRPGLWRSVLLYPGWGLIQQYAMQSFTYRRLREGTGHRPVVAAALTALLFASVHYPNTALALATLLGAFTWCLLFERRPNLFTLAISHGWLAMLLRISWPALWLHNLRIGPSYFTWTP